MRQIYLVSLTLFLLFSKIANACEPNPYSYNTLTKENWTAIKKITRNTSNSINRVPVNKYNITSILGSPDRCASSADGRTEQCFWIDGQDCKKKVQASFRDNELSKISKSGF